MLHFILTRYTSVLYPADNKKDQRIPVRKIDTFLRLQRAHTCPSCLGSGTVWTSILACGADSWGPLDPHHFCRLDGRRFANWHKAASVQIGHLPVTNCTVLKIQKSFYPQFLYTRQHTNRKEVSEEGPLRSREPPAAGPHPSRLSCCRSNKPALVKELQKKKQIMTDVFSISLGEKRVLNVMKMIVQTVTHVQPSRRRNITLT